MEGVIQRTSSQTKSLSSNNNVGVDKARSPKPPLLPKPQIIKLDSKYHKIVTTNSVSPLKATASQVPNNEKNEPINNNVIKQSIPSVTINGERTGQRPPSISSKPQLPPKLHSLNFVKPNSSLNSSEICKSPSVDFKNSSPADKAQFRPPKSPQKSVNKGDGDTYSIKKGLLDSAVLPNSLILSKQKSASLDRNKDLNWTIKHFINDPEQLSEFCKQVENCSKHSHILKKELDSLTPAHWRKKKLQETLDLAADIDCTETDNIIRADCVYEGGSDNNNKVGALFSEISSYTNGFQDEENTGSRNLEALISPEIPKSFLHSYVSSCNQTKDQTISDEKPTENENVNYQSFLHKNKDHKSTPKLSKSRSLGQHDSFIGYDSSNNSSFTKSSSVEKDRAERKDEPKKSENSPRPSSSDISSFGKRFPWFGSFGKGSKKDSVKKGRCLSQFYASSIVVDGEPILREKNRTKSLPDIKQTRLPPSGTLGVNHIEASDNQEITRISGEYPHSDSDEDKDSLNQVEFSSDKDSSTLAYLKAKELMTSEEVFIDVLKLLNVDFRNYVQLRNFENRNNCIPPADVNKILNHLSQLQSLNEDILEDLKKRIENWENNPKIADVIVKKGAFLKMYTTYIQNFESQTNYLDECIVKYPKFGKIVREFEATDRCKKLSLKHYMLKPVQRIPQYRLLLNDYVKNLDESSPDYSDTLSALKIVCDVVDHANRNVSHGDKEGRLMHFQSLLSDFELIRPGRELVKDGPLEKICRKTVRDRYFILLNDCLLHTTYSKQYLKIHQQLPLSGMKICYNDDQKHPSSFTVHSITKSFILCAKSEAECKDWVETLQKTIEEHIKRQKTFLNVKIEEDTSFKLGKEAPVWVQDGKVTMCQICTAEFTALFRRHHCRGCGKVVCRNCGSNQAPLQYRSFKPDRVCDQCFDLLLKDYEDSEDNICEILKETLNLNDDSVQHEYLSVKAKFIKYTSASNWKKQKYIPPRLKEVSANDSQSVISGWLYRKSKKSWKMFWYVLKDHVLYVYKASEDVLASETIPVLGYEVERASVNHEEVDKNLIFSLIHPRQEPIVFRAESQAAAERWFDALTTATNLDYLTI